jgi:hypothetical protein
MTWHGMAWHGMAWHGMAWHGMAWHKTYKQILTFIANICFGNVYDILGQYILHFQKHS